MLSPAELRERLALHSVSGRFDLFLGIGGGLTLLGLILFVITLGGDQADLAWQMFHVNWLFFTGLAIGSGALVASHKIAKAKWSGLIIRFAEAALAFLPLSLIGLVLIFTVGYEHLYGHMQHELHGLQHSKAVWLSRPFMFARLFIGLSLLSWVGWRMVRADLTPDIAAARSAAKGAARERYERWSRGYDGSPVALGRVEERIARIAPLYGVLYALVGTIIAFDMIMALQPHWFSNLLGGFYFMASFLGAHMLLALMTIFGSRHLGVTDLVSPKQRHDLGKLCFGFTVFWAYLMWAQFLVIWYGNLPEETGFVFARLYGPWLPVGRAVLLGLFVIPFIGLLGVAPKKAPATLGLFAVISLVALWLERYLLVMPSVSHEGAPHLGVPELGPTLLMAGLFLLA
ncbi:MAG: hypothetical protein M3Y31_05690, partial [Gemmatimonadota bacterium]|nr:hypothetical protein [Gemmatimonadota bacterium]